MADWHQNYNATGAPLPVGNLVVIGHRAVETGRARISGGVRPGDGQGSLALLDRPGTRRARLGDLEGEGIDHPGGTTWMTGTYDAELDTDLLAGRQSRDRI